MTSSAPKRSSASAGEVFRGGGIGEVAERDHGLGAGGAGGLGDRLPAPSWSAGMDRHGDAGVRHAPAPHRRADAARRARSPAPPAERPCAPPVPSPGKLGWRGTEGKPAPTPDPTIRTGLPPRAPAVREALIAWLDTFAGYVREVDYASARPLFHKDALAFGTFTNVIPGLEAWIATQWDNVWPKTTDFRFALDATHNSGRR
jgi:hypothetical protein